MSSHNRKRRRQLEAARKRRRPKALDLRPTCILPENPRSDAVCPICAAVHGPREPHNAQTLFYLAHFLQRHGREPTWADAIRHCPPDVRVRAEKALRESDQWTEPPLGYPVIAEDMEG